MLLEFVVQVPYDDAAVGGVFHPVLSAGVGLSCLEFILLDELVGGGDV